MTNMIFGDLYNLLKSDVLFEIKMNKMCFFKGTKNQFEDLKNKEYKGIESLEVGSLSIDNSEETENIFLPILNIDFIEVSLFKEGDRTNK
ncbi:hypothetical protein ACAG96_04520 [Candidatus Izemoplasma sp. B36]|uniref:hypothetical protein n=1 Tax=Candidatus Izemoplasma sp. B36 TaxID=3242468 RepID=UPI00355787A4